MSDLPAISRDRLVAELDLYLDADSGRDYCPNGLQVEGRAEVRRVVTGVSACLEFFERARELEADAVLVHHGILWEGASLRLTGVQARRVAALLEGGLNLIAYHLPLDRHLEVGNNAVAARRLGLGELQPFGLLDGAAIGCSGRFEPPLAADQVFARCAEIFRQEPLVFAGGPDTVHSVGIISGAAERSVYEAIERGLDLFITGEATEWVMNLAREAEIHFVSAGHYATERLGIQALGELVAERYGLDVRFVDVPNPV